MMTARHGSISEFFLKLSDFSLMLISLGLTIVYRYAPGQNPTFVVDYLSERVKVTNAILGFLLLLSWYAAFAGQGLYISHRLSSIGGELIRQHGKDGHAGIDGRALRGRVAVRGRPVGNGGIHLGNANQHTQGAIRKLVHVFDLVQIP